MTHTAAAVAGFELRKLAAGNGIEFEPQQFPGAQFGADRATGGGVSQCQFDLLRFVVPHYRQFQFVANFALQQRTFQVQPVGDFDLTDRDQQVTGLQSALGGRAILFYFFDHQPFFQGRSGGKTEPHALQSFAAEQIRDNFPGLRPRGSRSQCLGHRLARPR